MSTYYWFTVDVEGLLCFSLKSSVFSGNNWNWKSDCCILEYVCVSGYWCTCVGVYAIFEEKVMGRAI